MLRASIVALIYKSPTFAREFYKHLLSSTPEVKNGSAEFFYVANNASPQVLRTLRLHDIPHHVFNAPELTIEQHFAHGFAGPEYIGRVYAAYNFGVQRAQSQSVVLLNSDRVMSPNWLSALLAEANSSTVLSPQLVERNHPRFGVFPGALERNFGRDFRSMDTTGWNTFCSEYLSEHQSDLTHDGGPYMPAVFQKSWFNDFGGFPHGNIAGSTYDEVVTYGDEAFFNVLKSAGISHKTTPRSLCYHFKEGERATNPFLFTRTQVVPTLTLPLRRLYRKFKK